VNVRKAIATIALLGLSLVVLPAVRAQEGPTWKHAFGAGQPFLGTAWADPRVQGRIWATTTTNELFRSDDAGASWSSVASGLDGDWLALGAEGPDVLYAAGGGLTKSTDGGATWDIVPGVTMPLRSVFTSPSDPALLFVIDEGYRGFRSTDGGMTFKPVVGADFPWFFLVDRTDPQVVLAGNLNGQVLRSANGGGTFSVVHGVQYTSRIRMLVQDPFDPKTMYALNNYVDVPGEQVLISRDRGQTWSRAGLGLPTGTLDDIEPDVGSPGTLYVSAADGLYVTRDFGAGWTRMQPDGLYPPAGFSEAGVNVDDRPYIYETVAAAPGKLFVARYSAGRCFFSSDGGGRFVDATPGPTSFQQGIFEMSQSPVDPDTIWVIGEDGYAYRSTDGGRSYAWASNGLPVPEGVPVGLAYIPIAFTPLGGRVTLPRNSTAGIVAGAGDADSAYYLHVNHVYRTQDGGRTWSPGGSLPEVLTVAVDPAHPEILYAGTRVGVYRSGDAGASWRPASEGLGLREIWALEVDPSNPSTIYASVYPAGLWVSRDRGATWSSVPAGGLPQDDVIYTMEVAPDDPKLIVAAALRGGVWRSVDSGASFQRASDANTYDVQILAGGTIYLAGSGVQVSHDRGAAFGDYQDASSYFTGSDIYGLAADPRDPRHVAIGMYAFGYQAPQLGTMYHDPPA
jgi:photosystem II stability/assembly factor-like uncharacterized protein